MPAATYVVYVCALSRRVRFLGRRSILLGGVVHVLSLGHWSSSALAQAACMSTWLEAICFLFLLRVSDKRVSVR